MPIIAKASEQESEASLFPCSRCGAMLTFLPGTNHLGCEYCGQENSIEDRIEKIREYDFHQALEQLSKAKPSNESRQIQCQACGAGFKFQSSIHAGECPFCGSAIVTRTAESTPIKPKSLLPFGIDEKQAKEGFQSWLKGLWFAPSKVKEYARDDTKLSGVYLPYWTFDSSTETNYSGARGDIYYVRQQVQVMRNGRMVSRVRQVPQIRWTPVRGHVARFFDDVLVGASESLPRRILDRLEPWDLENLTSYDERYLSGFQSEYYQVDLDEGFDRAKQLMDRVIYEDIAFDIGGDHQRIQQVNTRHSDKTYKHCLLPIWSAAFRYREKSYRFIVNGRTGQVQGERPYSYWKIALTAAFGVLTVLLAIFFLDRSGLLQDMQLLYGF